MAEIEISSPAKINLFLAVTGRREDGFHSLSSLVAPLEFGDRISIQAKPGDSKIELSSDSRGIPLDERNLAWRAASRFLETFERQASISIHIEKRIPVGAGLGGGSSNAAATLLGLSELFGVDDAKSIRALAEELGSDCPLFIERTPLLMRGRGELIESLEPDARSSLAGLQLALFKPSFGISTAWAYGALASSAAGYVEASKAEAQLAAWKRGDRPIGDLLFNSFESVVGEKYPAIPLLLDRVNASVGAPCLMSGSGSCCFALGGDQQIAQIRTLVAESWGEKAFFQATRIADI